MHKQRKSKEKLRSGRKLREIKKKKKFLIKVVSGCMENSGESCWNLGNEEEETVKRKILCNLHVTKEGEEKTERRNKVKRNLKKKKKF